MKLTKDQQIVMLHDAARASSMDGHIVSEPPPSTMAERVMTWFGGRKNTPRKNSYLYLDSVDACFFYSNFGTPSLHHPDDRLGYGFFRTPASQIHRHHSVRAP